MSECYYQEPGREHGVALYELMFPDAEVPLPVCELHMATGIEANIYGADGEIELLVSVIKPVFQPRH